MFFSKFNTGKSHGVLETWHLPSDSMVSQYDKTVIVSSPGQVVNLAVYVKVLSFIFKFPSSRGPIYLTNLIHLSGLLFLMCELLESMLSLLTLDPTCVSGRYRLLKASRFNCEP